MTYTVSCARDLEFIRFTAEMITEYLAACGVSPAIPKETARQMLEMMCESARLKGERDGIERARQLVRQLVSGSR